MKKIILYIAMSLDGYIANKDGNVSWLKGDGSDIHNNGSYEKFIETIDTVILGYKTYYQIVTELSPDSWVYNNLMSYVITHKKLSNKKNIVFCNNLIELILKLKNENGKDIWICGGAEIANQLIDLQLIDKFYITVVPIILGSGKLLFSEHQLETKLKFITAYNYNGFVDIVYERKNKRL